MIDDAWKAFLKWLGRIFSALGRIVLEMISIKMIVAMAVSYIYLQNDHLGTVGFVIVAVMWMTVIGFRYAEKVMKLVHPVVTTASDQPSEPSEPKLNP